MSLRTWIAHRRRHTAARYLAAHRGLALDVLRQDPDLAVQALHTLAGLSAAAGEPERQTLAYPVLSQLGFGGRQALNAALPKATPFNLRRFSEIPPSRRALNAIANPILDMPWQIAPCDETLAAAEPDTWPADLRRRAAAFTRCLRLPNATDSWRVLLESILEDICVGGYGALELGPTGDPERPLWLWPVDGQSLRINVEWDGLLSSPRYTQSLGYVGLSVAMHDPVQLCDDELLYLRLNPRTNTPFGLGYLEVAFNCINAYLGAFDFAQRRASNATPGFLIFLGENVDIPTTRQWAQYWQQLIEGYGKAPIIGGGRAPQVLNLHGSESADPLYLKWQEWIVRQVAMAFSLSPMRLGLERDVNYSTAETQAASDWETVAPVAQTVADGLSTHVLRRVLGWGDLCFKWLIRDTDELRQSEVLRNRYESNAITVDEQREIWGLPPLPDGRGALLKAELEAQVAMSGLPTLGEPEEELGDTGTRGHGDAETQGVAQNGTAAD